MNKYIVTFDLLSFIYICALSSIEASSYGGLEAIEFDSCPSKIYCTQIGNATFSERLCECDSDCATFGDCCIDVARLNSSRQRQTCMQYGVDNNQGVYAIGTCSNTFSNTEVNFQCMYNNFSDPVMSAPVIDTSSGIIYLNTYCAICNDLPPASMKIWKVHFSCEDENLKVNSLSWGDIKYRPDVKKWGYTSDDRFNPCQVVYDKPPSVSATGRSCRPNLISSCSSNWTEPTHKRECETYMAVVTDRLNNAYKNPHCALCNHVKNTELRCLLTPYKVRSEVPYLSTLSVHVNPKHGDVVRVIRTPDSLCAPGYKYDPYFNKCRKLQCGIPGYVPLDGKCVNRKYLTQEQLETWCPLTHKYDPYVKKCMKLGCAQPGYEPIDGKCVKNEE